MSVPNGEKLATKQDLADMYQGILPYLGGMPEMVANKFSKGDLYSTDEKMIGQWIDGKPLYQKTISYDTAITVTNTENTVIIANLDSLNIDNAVNLEVSFKWDGIGRNTPFITYVTAGEIYVVAFVNRDNISDVIEFKTKRPSGTTQITEVKATIQYTKTTDSAISIGSDTDYSTEEKIVGTWIDGKALYQRSYNLGTAITVSPTTWTATGLDISSVENLIQCQGNNVGLSCPLIGTKAGDNTLKVVTTRAESSSILYITIQYTKTT